MKNIVCIGGLPGSGKTQLGYHLKKTHGFSVFDDRELARMYMKNNDTILQQLRYQILKEENINIAICNPLVLTQERKRIIEEIFKKLNLPAFLIYISEQLEDLIRTAEFRRTIIHIEGVKTSPEDIRKHFDLQQIPSTDEGWQKIRFTTQQEIKKLISKEQIENLF